jgi:hypothetical protein
MYAMCRLTRRAVARASLTCTCTAKWWLCRLHLHNLCWLWRNLHLLKLGHFVSADEVQCQGASVLLTHNQPCTALPLIHVCVQADEARRRTRISDLHLHRQVVAVLLGS